MKITSIAELEAAISSKIVELDQSGEDKTVTSALNAVYHAFREFNSTKQARLYEAAPDLLKVCEACLLRDDIANDELGDQLRATVKKAR